MSTKKDDSCLMKADENEPIFVLRAQDVTAPIVVMFWILLQMLMGVVSWIHCDKGSIAEDYLVQCSNEKLLAAAYLAIKMRAWPKHKLAD